MKRMSIERQMKAMEIMSKFHAYELDFHMDIKHDHGIRVSNLATLGSNEVNYLINAGFLFSITTNLGHTDDGYGFQVCIF